MPHQLSLHDDMIRFGIELRANRTYGFLGDAAFDFLAFAIAAVEILRERFSGREVASHQEVESLGGGFEPACSVETRGQLEANFVAANLASNRGYFLERDQSGALSHVESLDSGADEDAILAVQRNQVCNGAQRDEVEKRPEIELLGPRQTCRTTVLQNRMRQLESEADRTELPEAGCRTVRHRQLRVHQRDRSRSGIGDLVMIENQHIDAAQAEPANGLDRR